MTHLLKSLLACLLLTFSITFMSLQTAVANGGNDVRLVLIGVVLNEDSQRPLDQVEVVIKDNLTQEERSFTTRRDGTFYFKLDEDRVYDLFYTNDLGTRAGSRTLHTINNEHGIMHAVLSVEDVIRAPELHTNELFYRE